MKSNLGDPENFARGVEHLRVSDPWLRSILDKHGLIRFRPRGDVFESLVESIIGQQLAGAAADAIIKRVRGTYNSGVLEADAIYKTPVSKLRKAGVSPQKIRYLKDLSSRVVKGELDLKKIRRKSDAELIQELDQVLGIGPWTVHMLMIFTLGRPDVLPVDDLGIRKAVQNVYSLAELPRPKTIEAIATNWHPYCTVASLYLWREKDAAKQVK
jgi:DNA-3-methyladenine glycosylase II